METHKTYRAHGRTHTGTSGFSNHWPGSSDDVARALEQVFADHPDAVVLDGNDDWYAPDCDRPETYLRHFERLVPLAFFHSKSSGMSVSGIVVSREDFERIEREFPTKSWKWLKDERNASGWGCHSVKVTVTGKNLRDCVRVYTGA